MSHHLLLVDASGFAHRAFHSGAARYRSDGLPTWAITGFMGLVFRLLGAAQHDQPTLAAAVFDAPGPTFRHELFPAYKRNRPARDEELAAQLPYLRHAAAAMGITPVEFPGFEADDGIASLADMAAQCGDRVTIVSSDKDMAQLVKDGSITVIDPVAHCRWDEAFVRGVKFGVEPRQVPDYQALAGDDVDNIPGIDGIGPKHAASFVRLFGTVEEVVAATRTAPNFFTPSQRVRLKEPGALENLQLYRKLAVLRRDVPFNFKREDLALRSIMLEHVQHMLKTLEASTRFEEIFATTPKMQRLVDHMEDEFGWWQEELIVPGQPVPDLPQCGCYERRVTDGGVFVPAIIWREDEIDPITGEKTGQEILRCQVGEKPADPVQEWPRLFRSPISREKYEFEMADARWAAAYAKEDPKANPYIPVDFYNLKPPIFAQSASQKRTMKR